MTGQLAFIVEYQDGRKIRIKLNKYNLARGECVAAVVAQIRQEDGENPGGQNQERYARSLG